MRVKIDEMIARYNEKRTPEVKKMNLKSFAQSCYKGQTDSPMSYYQYIRNLNDDRAEFVRVHDLYNFALTLGCDVNDLIGFKK